MLKLNCSTELQSALDLAYQAADQGRAILLKHFGNLKAVTEKEGAGLVSEADQESETTIISTLRAYSRNVSILGEESSFSGGEGIEKFRQIKDLWIIDPLDGTNNYVYRLPFFAISIALKLEGTVQLGLIDLPVFNQRFVGLKGYGAFCNEQRLSVSSRTSVGDIMLATGFSARRSPDYLGRQLEIMGHLVSRARCLRRTGSAAMDLCMVAQGSFDLYWEEFLSPWDTAAGMLLVSEAGGLVTNYKGEPYEPFMNDIVAGTTFAHSHLLPTISRLSPRQQDDFS